MQGLVDAGTVTTVNGAELTIAESGDLIEVNGVSMVVCGNVQTANAHRPHHRQRPGPGRLITECRYGGWGPWSPPSLRSGGRHRYGPGRFQSSEPKMRRNVAASHRLAV